MTAYEMIGLNRRLVLSITRATRRVRVCLKSHDCVAEGVLDCGRTVVTSTPRLDSQRR